MPDTNGEKHNEEEVVEELVDSADLGVDEDEDDDIDFADEYDDDEEDED